MYGDGFVDVSVDNDGATAGAPSQGAGLGLQGLQERVAHVGGSMEAGITAPGRWRLRATIPSRQEKE